MLSPRKEGQSTDSTTAQLTQGQFSWLKTILLLPQILHELLL